MNIRIYAGIPLTLMMAITLLQCGAAAGWWPTLMPRAALLTAGFAWACGSWLVWRTGAAGEPFKPPPRPAFQPSAVPIPDQAERRRTTRFHIRRPVELSTDHGRIKAELRDISHGGARIFGVTSLEPDSYGMLLVEGITLPVPFFVVGDTPQGDLRVRFELTGLALDSFLRQFARLVDVEAGTMSSTRS